MTYKDYSDIAYDSRKVQKNSIFVAIDGGKSDGHNYIAQALKAGAKLIVLDEAKYIENKNFYDKLFENYKADFELSNDTRLTLAQIAHSFYSKASEKLCVIGVTGTNGKTTVTHLIQDLLDDCAILGTMGLRKKSNDDYIDQGNTTPQSKEIHKIINLLTLESYKYLAMEVSSHALEQKRVACIAFKYSIVTNLTQDHLDYHITMDNYFKAKAKIFTQSTEFAILNLDDEYFEAFAKEAHSKNLKVVTVSTKNANADFLATDIKFDFYGLSYVLKSKTFGQVKIDTKLNSEFNVYNSMFAIVVALYEGLSLEVIANKFKEMKVVAGRFEAIKTEKSPFCIIDYAHSPDGLYNVLKGAKALLQKDSKLICVFGCGGDRDITKRPKMGKIAFENSDKIYVTSDNPRSEDPDRIIADILTGLPDLKNTKVIADRQTAIQSAIKDASDEDIIVIAGKGHENYQILKDKTIHFDDKEEVEMAIKLFKS